MAIVKGFVDLESIVQVVAVVGGRYWLRQQIMVKSNVICLRCLPAQEVNVHDTCAGI